MITPRCIVNGMPMFLSADSKLKPCCFLNTSREYAAFITWGKQRGYDVEFDLDTTLHSINEIHNSPTWKGLIESFKTEGDSPEVCDRACGPGSYTSTTGNAKHSTFEE